MTRDSKLALVIAITMILLVGVLISDHFSGATEAAFDAPQQDPRPASPILTLSDPIAQIARREPDPAPTLPDLTLAPAGDAGSLLNEDGPIEISQAGGEGLLDQAFERFRSSEAPALVGASKPSETLGRTGLFDRVDSTTVTLPPPAERRVESPIKPMNEPERGTSSGGAAPAGAWRTHKVVEGDSLYAIARAYFGDGDRYPEIQAANEDQLRGGTDITVGMVLRIDRSAKAPTQATTQPAARKAEAKQSQAPERTYVVLRGDILGKVAQKLLGSSKRMDEIVKLNGLKDADDIKVGQTLRIPAR